MDSLCTPSCRIGVPIASRRQSLLLRAPTLSLYCTHPPATRSGHSFETLGCSPHTHHPLAAAAVSRRQRLTASLGSKVLGGGV